MAENTPRDQDAPPPKSARSKKKPAKAKPPRPPKTAKAARAPQASWTRWLLWEAATASVGIGIGIGIATWVVWRRAERDVAAWLADPPDETPGVVWSAPIDVHPGQRLSLPALAGDLVAAGFDRVTDLPPASPTDVFAVDGDTLRLWTAKSRQHATVRVERGWVVETHPAKLTLPATALATVGGGENRRDPVSLEQLSPWVEPALLAIEDSRFRSHYGVDPVGLGRALVHNAIGSGGSQGGSTLTQQLAKNLFLSRERTVQRKIRELFFAAALERALSKDALLELYLGEVYLGQFGGLPLHGVEQASRAWFGKSARRLELDEAALVAGVISAPSAYNPARDPHAARVRRDRVLDRMVATGSISADQAEKAKARSIELRGDLPGASRRAPYAVDAAVDAAEAVLGEGAIAERGWQVHTFLQPVLQRAAEEAVAAGLRELEASYPEAKGAQAALVAIDSQTGGVVALVGGRDYATSMYNRALLAHRQAGSTVKALTLLAALDRQLVTPSDRLDDQPITRQFSGSRWTPQNYDGKFLGSVTVRQAIEGSRNIPAIHLAERVGLEKLKAVFHSTGLPAATAWPSAALGSFDVTPLEMAGAYTAFPTGGVWRLPRLVDRAAAPDAKGAHGFEGQTTRIAGRPATAMATHVLEGVMSRGTGASSARYGARGSVAGKSGTTDGFRDAWFVGFTPTLVVAVWVGQDEGALGLSGAKAALPTWARFVAASGTLGGHFPRPEGVLETAVCAASGQLPRPTCVEVIDEWFAPGSAPEEPCDVHPPAVAEAARGLLGGLLGRRRDGD